MNRGDLYPCGYPKRGCTIGRPKPQPRTPDPAERLLVARLWRLTFAVLTLFAAGLIAVWRAGLLAGRG